MSSKHLLKHFLQNFIVWLLFMKVNLPRWDSKNGLLFLFNVLQQQACCEKPTLKALLSFVVERGRWWMPGRWWRVSWNEVFIYTAELHLVILIAYRHFSWTEGMNSVFSSSWRATLSVMSQKIPLLFSYLHTLPYLYWEDSFIFFCKSFWWC